MSTLLAGGALEPSVLTARTVEVNIPTTELTGGGSITRRACRLLMQFELQELLSSELPGLLDRRGQEPGPDVQCGGANCV